MQTRTRISHIFALLLLWTMGNTSYAQEKKDSIESYTPSIESASKHYDKMTRRQTQYSIDMGGYVSSWGSGNNAWGMHFNPQVTVPVGKRVDLTAGIDVYQNYYNGAAYIPWGAVRDSNGRYRGNSTEAIVYLSARYYASRRLSIHGSAFLSVGDTHAPFMPVKGVNLGANYRIGRRAMIGVDFSYMEVNAPMGIHPFMPMLFPMGSPFGMF